MPATLPNLTRRLDDDFVNTWYEIQAHAIDNILEATVITLALRELGAMKQEIGGTYGWTGTVRFGTKSTQRFQAGSTLEQEVPDIDTLAVLDWRFFCVDVNRAFADDMINMGPWQIKSYIAQRLEVARNAIVQDIETMLAQWGAYYAAPKQPNGLFDVVAPQTAETTGGDGSDSDTYASGTSNGGLNRTNTWWRNWVAYDDATEAKANKIAGATNEPYTLSLASDMDHFFNCVSANQEPPNLILSSQNIFEAYTAEAAEKMQIVRSAFNRKAADLGFTSATFKGAAFSYSAKITGNHVIMLNMNHIDFNYHPNAWFDMTEWMTTPNQLERVAYIVCMTPGLATKQPRRHGIMTYAS